METIQTQDLNEFLKNKQKEILAIAQQNTKEIVEKENALMDFELSLSINISGEDKNKLTEQARKLRQEYWEETMKESNGDYKKAMEILDKV